MAVPTPAVSVRSAAAPATTTKINRSWRSLLAAGVLLLASSGLMAGCGDIMVTGRSAVPPVPSRYPSQRGAGVSEAPVTREMHDLAVAAVDFDPALNMDTIISGRPYSLLVAIENKGNRLEAPLTVTAQLLTADRTQILLTAERTVQMLAPGDITVARFPVETAPPRRRAYILSARVQAVPRDADLSNNSRLLDIQVSSGN